MSKQTFNNQASSPGTPAAGKLNQWSSTTNKRFWFTDENGMSGPIGISPYFYDVTDYGVLPSNSASTNITNLNALLASAPAGSEIHFSTGTYSFNAAWNGGSALSTNYIFTGVRGGTSLSWTSNVGGDLIKTTTSGYYTEFRDLQFSTTVAQTAGYVIHFGDGAVGPCVRNCIFAGQSGTATLAGLMSFDNAGSQGSNSGNETYIYDILASNFTGIGINLNSTLVQLVVKGAVMNGKTSSSAHATSCITVISCGYIQLDNCDLIGAVNNLAVTPTVGLVAASIFANNTFFDQSTGSSLKISGAGTVVRAHFIGCWFTLDPGATSQLGVEISTSGSSTHQGIVFEACKIYNTPAATTAVGLSATAVGDLTVANCVIAGWAPGISITPASPNGTTILNITGNTIGPGGGVSANTTGIALLAGAVQYGAVSIQGNILSGNTTALTDASTYALGTSRIILANAGLATAPKAIIATSGAINTTETYIATAVSLPANSLLAGTTLRLTLQGTCTTTAANVSTFTVRVGTTGTTPASDTTATVALAPNAAGVAGTNIGFVTTILITARAIGASTVLQCSQATSSTATGITAATVSVTQGATGAFNNNSNLFLNVSYKSAATTTTSTFQMATWEVLQQ